MHETHKTKAFVISGTHMKEGDRFVTLFTRELGLIRAIARSVREERSKLRYSLQDLSLSEVSLVRGRDVWRVTGAQVMHSLYYELKGEPEKLVVLARIFSLLTRLLQGEEKNEELFDLLYEGTFFLIGSDINKETVQNFEYVMVLRILARLGYIGDSKELSGLLETSPFDAETLAKVSPLRLLAAREINTAIKESQL